MLFSLILVVATIVAWVLGRHSSAWPDHARRGLAAAMVIAGTGHLLGPGPFLQHLPAWVPAREALVYGSGLVEIGLGLALLSHAWRVAAGRLLALFLLAVWPANFYVAVAGVDVAGQPGGVYPWVRLPLQILFIGWALWSTRLSVPVGAGRSDGGTCDPNPDHCSLQGSDATVESLRWRERAASAASGPSRSARPTAGRSTTPRARQS